MACDKHVVKMIVESAQLLCSAFEPGTAPYRRISYNHPCARWVRDNENNYKWLIQYSMWLLKEYHHRYRKRHKCTDVILWCNDNYYKLNLSKNSFFEPPQCFGTYIECRVEGNAVQGYINYYRAAKIKFAKWTKREVPGWIQDLVKI